MADGHKVNDEQYSAADVRDVRSYISRGQVGGLIDESNGCAGICRSTDISLVRGVQGFG